MDLLAAYMWIAYPCLPAGLHSHKVLQWVMKGGKHALLLPHKQVLLSCRWRAASGGSDTAQHPRSQSGKNVLYQPDVQMVVSPCAKSVGCSGSGKGCQRS